MSLLHQVGRLEPQDFKRQEDLGSRLRALGWTSCQGQDLLTHLSVRMAGPSLDIRPSFLSDEMAYLLLNKPL